MENAYKVTEYYVGSTENINLDNKQGLFDMFTDSGFLYGTYKTINYLMKNGVTVYQYILSYEGEFSFSEIYGVPPTGVCHADDQLYLWNPWLLGPLSGDDITGYYCFATKKSRTSDQSIGSTETKYIKLNTKTPIFFNNIRLCYTL